MEMVTRYAGEKHISAEDWAELNRGLTGAESYALPIGRKFETELVSNNLLKIYDGCGVMQGRQVRIPAGQSEEITIENGTQGEKRIDLIVERYTKNEDTKVESSETILIKGTPSETDPQAPACTEGDIRAGDTTADWPLYEVELDGINVVAVRAVFKMLLNMSTINASLSYLNGNKIDTYNVNVSNEVLTGETFAGKPVYQRLVDTGALPNNTSKTINTGITNTDYFWIDPTYSMAISGGAEYPLPYVDPANIANSIGVRIIANGQSIIVSTHADWSTYAGFVAVKYTKQ